MALFSGLIFFVLLLLDSCLGAGKSFQRNAVESNNNLQRTSLAEYVQLTFGTKELPLRDAVEFAIEKYSIRVPLRDAVEHRPAPSWGYSAIEPLLARITKEPLVLCYFASWGWHRKGNARFAPENLETSLCTHIIYAYAGLDPNTLLIQPFDPWADIDNELYERVTSQKGPKHFLALGGWTDSAGDKYSKLAGSSEARKRFAANVATYLISHGFNGLHLDWAYPTCWQSDCSAGPASDRDHLTALVLEIKNIFSNHNPPLEIGVSISGYKEVIERAYDLRVLADHVSMLTVSAYDYHGAWEGRTSHPASIMGKPDDQFPKYNIDSTIQLLLELGAPASKLVLGVPFHGQSYTLKTPSENGLGAPTLGPGLPGEGTLQPGVLSYYEICERVKSRSWKVTRSSDGSSGPYAHAGDQWVGFEDAASVGAKARYATRKGLAGVMAWTMDLDDFNNKCCIEPFPLLRALNRALGRLKSTQPSGGDCTRPPPPVTPKPPQTTTAIDSGEPSTTTTWQTTTSTTTSTTTPRPTKRPTTTKPTTTTEKPSTTTEGWWSTRPPTTTTTSTTTTTTSTTTTTTTQRPTTTVTTTTSKPPETGPTAPIGDLCSSGSGEYFPEPTNCNAYYRCIMGQALIQYCPGNLHWNAHSKVCDWPDSANCKPALQEESTPAPIPSPLPTLPSTTFPSPTAPSPPQPAPPPIWTTVRPPHQCTNGQYYPSPTSCQSFYFCVNSILVEQKCPPGLAWDQELAMCDWVHQVKCQGRMRTSPGDSCEDGSYSAYPEDCSRYLFCIWAKYEEFNCPNGLVWNQDKKICDWPKNEICQGLVGGPENPPTTKPPSQGPTSKPTTTTKRPETSTPPDLGTTLPEEINDYFKMVCYFTNWAWYRPGTGKYLPENIDSRLCTHIVYGFAVLDYENLIIKPHDSWADIDNKFYERVVAFKRKGLKVSLALGGWNDSLGDKYSRLVNNPAARARFVKHALEFIEKYGFDGLDLDWEYPKCWQVDCSKGPASDKPAFASLVRELREAFKPKGLLLSSAVSPSKTVINEGYDVPALSRDLDWIAVMCYDYHGQWDKQTGHLAPLYVHEEDVDLTFNANFSLHYWIEKGADPRKLVMGMPLYGQSFTLTDQSKHGLNAKASGGGQAGQYTRAQGFLAYYEICNKIQGGSWTVVKDESGAMGPYAYQGNQWVSFDDKETLRKKSEFLRDMNLGGGMVWALDLDDFRGLCGEGSHPLLSTIRSVLAKGPKTSSSLGSQPTSTTTTTQSPNESEVTMKPDKPMKPEMTTTSSKPKPGVTTKPSTSTSKPSGELRNEYKIVCYFTNWAWYRQNGGKYLPQDIDPDLCTHIVYGFAVLDSSNYIIKPHDSWADIDNKFYERVVAFKKKGIKVSLALGGWNDSAGDKYSRLVNNPSARARFVKQALEFLEKYDFDGLDLDWEYPKCWQVDCNKGPASDKQAFADLVRELRAAFDPKGLLLSSAVSPSKTVVDEGYDVPTLSKNLDWIAVMCYDYHGQWDKRTGHVAPLYAHSEDDDVTFNSNFSINHWIKKGADPRKLVWGMPMYGQSFSLASSSKHGLNEPTYGGGEAGDATRARGFLAYYEICERVLNRGWNLVQDEEGAMGPYAYRGDQWVSFDDAPMIRRKSELVIQKGLGGAMIWALDLDDFTNRCGCEPYPLLRTINRVLRGYAPGPDCTLQSSERSGPEDKDKMPEQSAVPDKEKTPEDSTSKPISEPCGGLQFAPNEKDCNKYFFCQFGHLEEQSCPNQLYWNKDHCDWPENTECGKKEESGSTPGAGITTTTTTMKPQITTPSTSVTTPTEESTTQGPEGGDHTEENIGTPGTNIYKLVCYFTNWAWYRQGAGKYLPEDFDSRLCTHIVYGFAVLDSERLIIKPHDSWADIDNRFYERVVGYKKKGLKVSLALGGWNDSLGGKYSRLVNDPAARARFIKHALEFIEKYGFDGLDLDWEYPKCWQVDCNKGPASDKPAFASLVRELREAFKPKGLLLSSAVSPSKTVINEGYDVPALSRDLDWIAVMCYDYHGQWDKQTGHVAPLYVHEEDIDLTFNANFSLHYWIEKGADPRKLVMGMPLYGQSFTLTDQSKHGLNAKASGGGQAGQYTRAQGFLAYYEICDRIRTQSWTIVKDTSGAMGPYAYHGNQWVSYDEVSDIRRKVRLLKELSLGGAMVWALDLDDFRNLCGCGKHPLLGALKSELNGGPGRTKDCT